MIKAKNDFRYTNSPAGHIAVKLLPLNIISIFLLLCVLMLGAIEGDELFREFAETSRTLSMFQGDYSQLFVILLVPSMLSLLISNYLYLKKLHIFIFCLVLLFAMAEVAIPLFNKVAIFIRYLLLLTMASGGIAALFSPNNKIQAEQIFGVIMMALVVMHIVIDGMTQQSVAMLPVQIAVFLGMLVGLPAVISDVAIVKTLKSIALAGLCVTFVHLSSLFVISEPFLAGRFRSYLSLPTNFANGYVLLLMAMMWMGMYSTKFYKKILYFSVSAIGIYLIYLSGTRNAFVALIVGLLLFSIIWKRAYFVYLISAIIILLVAYYALDLSSDRLSETGARLAHVSKTETRFLVWSRALDYIGNRPYWGYGLDMNMSELDSKLPEWEKFDTHNAYLGLWLRLGFLGVLTVLAIYIKSFIRGYKMFYKRANKKLFADIAILPLCILLMIFIAGIFEENLSSKGNLQQILFGFSVAILIVLARKYKPNSTNMLGRQNVLPNTGNMDL